MLSISDPRRVMLEDYVVVGHGIKVWVSSGEQLYTPYANVQMPSEFRRCVHGYSMVVEDDLGPNERPDLCRRGLHYWSTFLSAYQEVLRHRVVFACPVVALRHNQQSLALSWTGLEKDDAYQEKAAARTLLVLPGIVTNQTCLDESTIKSICFNLMDEAINWDVNWLSKSARFAKQVFP